MNNLSKLFQKYEAIVVLDVETTGLDAKNCHVIELAAIRIEQAENKSIKEAGRMNTLIQLPANEHIPERITELTGITDEMLENEGTPEGNAVAEFSKLITSARTLLVAHNAQFDIRFIRELIESYTEFIGETGDVLDHCDYLDTLTVLRDRRPYPHTLAAAIKEYGLTGSVSNSHRAIDDVEALLAVLISMDNERGNLQEYINLFGYNPKFGVINQRIPRIRYWPQNAMARGKVSMTTLPQRYKYANSNIHTENI